MTAVHAANKEVNKMVDKSDLNTPAKKYVHRLSHGYENLQAHYLISQQENRNYKRILSARKERASGKRAILKNVIIASAEEIFQSIDEAERKTKARKKKRKATKKRKWRQDSESSSSSESESDEAELDAPILYSEIEVEM
jgi:hypothetical protein